MRRIAIIVPDCGEGGLFQFYKQLVPALAAHIDVQLVFASPTHSALVPSISGATCHVLPPESAAPILARLLQSPLAVAPNLARMLAVAHNAWRTAVDLKPDCIEVCDWPLGAVPAVLDGSIPAIVQGHGSMAQIAQHDPAPGGEVAGMLVQLIESQVIGLAQAMQTYAKANASFWEMTARRPVSVIRPAFALDDGPLPPSSETGGIAVFGRLQAWKGPQVLCGALDQLGARAPSCDWYGGVKPWPGTDLLADAHLAATYPSVWGRSLRFHAPVDRTAVARLMAASRAVIVPSTWDVFNFTAIEAMAAARPVIVSTGAGASELVEHGVNGLKFANGDVSSLADAIEQLLALSPGKARAMGEAARVTVRRDLDPARIAAERLNAYDRAIAAITATPPRVAPDWLRDLLSPGSLQSFSMTDFLETLPALPMLRSLGHRSWRKMIADKEG